MSELTGRIAREHRYYYSMAQCECGKRPLWMEDYPEHIAEVTEAALRERIIERLLGQASAMLETHNPNFVDGIRYAVSDVGTGDE